MTEELRKAIETLENEGLYICNQYNGCFGTENAEYELWNREELGCRIFYDSRGNRATAYL